MRKIPMIALGFIVALSGYASETGAPGWFKSPPKREGNNLFVNCKGEGPSIDLARNDAIDACKATASYQLAGNTRIKSLAIESEKDSSLQVEVENEVLVNGLNCIQQNEKISESQGYAEVFIQCKFDVSKVSVVAESNSDQSREDGKLNKNKSSYQRGSSRTLSLATIPRCESIMILGHHPRTVRCNSNPVDVVLYSDDTEMIVRCLGFKPKKIELNSLEGTDLNVQVKFD